MINEDDIHEILMRINGGELIGRGEGKTSALLHLAIDILISHENTRITYIHQGLVEHYIQLLELILEKFFNIRMVKVSSKKFKIENSTIEFKQYNKVSHIGPHDHNDINIYDIPNDERESKVISGPRWGKNFSIEWLNPNIQPNYEKYLPYNVKPSMDMQSSIAQWGAIND